MRVSFFAIAAFCSVIFSLVLISAETLFSQESGAQASTEDQPEVMIRLDFEAPFIVSMLADGDTTHGSSDGGGAFIGTEDYGVYHYRRDGSVTQFTTQNGLGDDNAYALAIDKLGRLWVGHLNTGVSVFNGKEWRNYDVIDGPIGERIFDIQTCPVDGDVWMATSAGITRYKIDSDEWEHFTREDGLLEDQASSLAFKNDGTLIVGTQCHGIALFTRNKNGEYKHAKNITAPERFGANNCSPVPLIPLGDGLPTNQINQILVARDGTIWIATPTGLVKSNDKLTQMQFARGRDYADKVRGLYGGAPKDWQECSPEVMKTLLPEDYITCLSEADDGTIWIGTRLKGFMAIDPQTGKRGTGDQASMGMTDNYVSAILPMPDSMPLIGLYIGGVIKPNRALTLKNPASSSAAKSRSLSKQKSRPVYSLAKNNFPPLPSPIKPPTLEELKLLQAKLEKLNKPLPKVYAGYYGEDWKTQGDWMGRYGRQLSCLCGAAAPFDHFIQSNPRIDLWACIGPNSMKDDELRRWVHWLKTDNPRTLYSPYDGYRRQSEWDDHGEVYPMTKDGTDLWILLDIMEEDEGVLSNLQSEEAWMRALLKEDAKFRRKGLYRATFYFFNKDGHTGHNRLRDYMIEVYPATRSWKEAKETRQFAEYAESLVREMPPLARARVKDFWGGTHKQFLLMGAGRYLIKIRRNYSFNTIISSVCVDHFGIWTIFDQLGGWINSEDEDYPLQLMYEVKVSPPELPKPTELTETDQVIFYNWNLIQEKVGRIGSLESMRTSQIAVYQRAATEARQQGEDVGALKIKQSLEWRLNQWTTELRKEFSELMQKAWIRLGEINPEYVEQQKKQLEEREKGTWKNPWEGLE